MHELSGLPAEAQNSQFLGENEPLPYRRIGSVRGRCYHSPFNSSDVPECVVMAAVCEVCGKHPSFGMAVSHSHRRTKRRWNPNIQRVRAVVNGSTKRVNVCTSCLKAGKVVKAVR